MLSSKGYVPEIDGLRAVAVLSVLAYHLNPSLLPGGFTGVDVFFVISGFVVTRSILIHTEHDRGSSWLGHLAAFYARRFRRIVPALTVCLLATCLLTYMFIPTSWLSANTEGTGRAAFWGVSNFVLALNQDTYFAPRTEYNPFAHTWSLGVEEQFYAIIPLFIVATSRLGTQLRGWLSFQTVFLASVSLLSLGFAVYWGLTRPQWAFYLLPSRLWELGAGSLLCLIRRDLMARRAIAGAPLPGISTGPSSGIFLLGIAMILFGLLYSDPTHFPFPWALVPVIGSVLAMLSITAEGGPPQIAAFLRWRPVVFVGLISYSLYLWHWPVIVVMRWTVGIEDAMTMLFAAALSVALAAGSWRFIERPFREGLPKLNAGVVVAVSLAVVLASSLANDTALAKRSSISLSVTRDEAIWRPNGDLSLVPEKGQMLGRQMFVVGNSHSGAYARMLSEAERDLGINVTIISDTQCRTGEIMRPTGVDPDCRRFQDDLLHQLESLGRPGDIVFFASRRMPRITDQWYVNGYEATFSFSRSPAFAEGLSQSVGQAEFFISQLERAGLMVMFDMPKPVLPAPAFRCSDWFNRGNPICAEGLSVKRSKLESLREPVVGALIGIRSRHPEVMIWDPFPVLCPAEVCSAFDEAGLPLFFDGDHLSGHGNLVLYPSFRQFLLDNPA